MVFGDSTAKVTITLVRDVSRFVAASVNLEESLPGSLELKRIYLSVSKSQAVVKEPDGGCTMPGGSAICLERAL